MISDLNFKVLPHNFAYGCKKETTHYIDRKILSCLCNVVSLSFPVDFH